MSTTTTTATYLDPAGDPCKGRVVFRLVAATYHDGLAAIFPTVPVAAVLNDAGEITVELEPTSGVDADFDATDMTYQVVERINGTERDAYYVDIPTAATVDLGTLVTYDDPLLVTRVLVDVDADTLVGNLDELYERRKTNSVVLFGDSITALCDDSGTTVDWFRWAQRIAGFPADVLNNAGVGSNTTTQMLARITTDVLDYEPAWCVVLGGTNDIGADNASSSAVIANLQTIYDRLTTAGINVIAGTITPSDYISATTTKLGNMEKVNQWIKDYPLTNPNVRVVDWYAPLVDTSTGGISSTCSADGVHPNHYGCIRMGRLLAPVLQECLPTLDRLNSSPVKNANGNLLANGLLIGSSAGVATSWATGSYGTAIVATASKVARADLIPGEWQQIAYTSGDFEFYYQNTAVGVDWSVGETVFGRCEIELDLPWATLTSIHARVDAYPAATSIGGGDPVIGTVSPLLPVDDLPNRLVLQTTPGTIPVGTTRVQFKLRCVATGAGTFRVGRPEVRKVTA